MGAGRPSRTTALWRRGRIQVMSYVAYIPVSKELLADVPTVDYTTDDIDREVLACRYCKMVHTRYGRLRCRLHQYRWNGAFLFGSR